MNVARPRILIRGGGDLATGVAARLFRSGFDVIVTEIAKPLAVRRLVALAEAIYAGKVAIEELRGQRIDHPVEAENLLAEGIIPILVDPNADSRSILNPIALVDGRMTKQPPETRIPREIFTVGLGPGFTVGMNCHAVVETNRGHRMGRVYWEGSAEPDTAIPERVASYDVNRVLRAPAAGVLENKIQLASTVKAGDVIASVNQTPLTAPFAGVLRGLLHSGLEVEKGMKVGDLDPRGEVAYCYLISDKSLAVGGGVLEALLSRADIRSRLSHDNAA
jgi:xanthine dehydrogenase accessory factor